ncbi:MAG: MotE family protein [Methylocystis sp.]|jgi:flagellar motility protein MotE (MotC chaperone)
MPRHFSRALLGFIPIALIGAPVLSIFVPLALAGTKTPGVVASSTSDASRDTALQQNCVNVANVATAARMAFQEKKLSELEQRLEHKLTEIQTRRQELKELLDRYDAFTNKADDTVIDIYSKMKPESAASQLANLDDESAAAILIKLRPKSSSAILNEMDTFHASLLTKKIVLFSSLKHGDKKR